MKQVCVVTGATGGIGSACVKQMCELGYIVIVSDINEEKINAKVEEMRALGYEAEGLVCDTSSPAQCGALAEFAASLGRVQGVIQLAGLTPAFATARDIVKVDVLGTMHINEAFYRVMEPGAAIMDIGSCAGHFMPQEMWPEDIFELSLTDKDKFLEEFVEYLEDFGDGPTASNMAYVFGRSFVWWYARKCNYPFGRNKGIRVNTVSIGLVETPQSIADLKAVGDYDERMGQQMSYSAFGRPGTPEEVAFCIATTIDIRNSYLSGCDIYFDNGCDANGYMGQFDPFDPSSVVYDPEQKITI